MNRVIQEYGRLRSSKYLISGIEKQSQKDAMEYAYKALEMPVFMQLEIEIRLPVEYAFFLGLNFFHPSAPNMRRLI